MAWNSYSTYTMTICKLKIDVKQLIKPYDDQ